MHMQSLEWKAQSIYAICGDPVHQVKLPNIFNQAFINHSVNANFIPLQLEEAGIESLFELFKRSDNFKGIVVTMPYKAAALQFIDCLSTRSRKLGLVNVVYKNEGKLIGDMTDGIGMYDAIKAQLTDLDNFISNLSMGVVGFGAAAKTILHQFVGAGLREIVLFDDGARRNETMSLQKFIHSLNAKVDVSLDDSSAHCSLLLNASPLGMSAADESPFTHAQLSHAELVADVVGNQQSKLQQNCKALSIPYVSGSDMALAQSPRIAELFGMPHIFNSI